MCELVIHLKFNGGRIGSVGGHRISTVEAFLVASCKQWGLSGACHNAENRIQQGQGSGPCSPCLGWMPTRLS